MSTKNLSACIILISLCPAGCLSPEWDGSVPPRRPLGAAYSTVRADGPAGSPPAGGPLEKNAPSAPAAAGPLTLRDAIARALRHNPALGSAAWGVREAEAARLQAGLPPNPELEAEFENIGGSGEFRGTDALETTIVLSQLVELGGKRTKRERLAHFESRLAGWDYEARRLAVITETARKFIAALSLQHQVAVAKDNLALADKMLQTVSRMVDAGKLSLLEQSKARVEVARARMRHNGVRRTLAAARAGLAALWAGHGPPVTALAGNLEAVSNIPPADDLAAYVEDNPAAGRWETEMHHRRAAVALAAARAIPDITAGIGFRHFGETPNNDYAFLAAFSMPLPLYDRNQGGIAKARAGLARTLFEKKTSLAQLRAAFQTAYQDLAAAHMESVSLRDEIMPAAHRAHEASMTSFRAGKADYLDVLDAQRTLVSVRKQYLQTLAAYHIAVATVEGIIGRRLDTIGDTGRKETTSTPTDGE